MSQQAGISRVSDNLQLAKASRLKAEGTAIAARDKADAAYVNLKILDGVSAEDAVTKSQLDAATAGSGAFWSPVAAAEAVSNITLSGVQSVGGVVTGAGTRVLVLAQTSAAENGIYETSAIGAWTRAADADEDAEFKTNKSVQATGGTNAGNVYAFDGPDDPVVDTDPVNFTLKQANAGVADGSITTAKLASDAVTGAKIADDAVDTEHLAAAAVDEAALAAGAVTNAKLGLLAVDSANIALGAVGTAALGADAVTGAKIADDAVGSEHIAADAVTNAAIAAGAVGTAELADLSVSTPKLQANSVTQAKIAADAVGTAEIADDSVTLAKLSFGGVAYQAVSIAFDDTFPLNVGAALPAGAHVIAVKVLVNTAWDVGELEIGTSGDPDKVMSQLEADAQSSGAKVRDSLIDCSADQLVITQTGSPTQGSAVVAVGYIVV